MTATDELRRLLDERGVEHYDGTERTLWGKDASGYRFSADELTSGRMSVHMWCETPEQAIDATLGSCNCSNSERTNETCRNVCNSVSEFTCSECGFNCDLTSWISLFDGDDGRHRHHHLGIPNFCPNCGKRREVDA